MIDNDSNANADVNANANYDNDDNDNNDVTGLYIFSMGHNPLNPRGSSVMLG